MEITFMELAVCMLVGMVGMLIYWLAGTKREMEETSKQKEEQFEKMVAMAIGQVSAQVDNKIGGVQNHVQGQVVAVQNQIKHSIEDVTKNIKLEVLQGMVHMKNEMNSTVTNTVQQVRTEVEHTVSHNVDKVLKRVETTKSELMGKASVLNWFSENPLMVAFGIGAITSLVLKYMSKNKFRGEAKINEFDTPFQKGMKVAALILDYLIGIGILVGATVGFVSSAKYNALKDVGQLGLGIVGKAKNLMKFFGSSEKQDGELGVVVQKTKEQVAEEELKKVLEFNGSTPLEQRVNGVNGECVEFKVNSEQGFKYWKYEIPFFVISYVFTSTLPFEKFTRPLETEKKPEKMPLVQNIIKVLSAILASWQNSKEYNPGIYKFVLSANSHIALRLTKVQTADLYSRCKEDPIWMNDFAYVIADSIPGFCVNNLFLVYPLVGHRPHNVVIAGSETIKTVEDDTWFEWKTTKQVPADFDKVRGFYSKYWTRGCAPMVKLRRYYKPRKDKPEEPDLNPTTFSLVTTDPNLEPNIISTVQVDKSFSPEIMTSLPIDPFCCEDNGIDLTLVKEKESSFKTKLKNVISVIDVKDSRFWIIVVGGVFLLTMTGIAIGWTVSASNKTVEKKLKRRGEAQKVRVKEKPFYVPSVELMKHEHYAKKKIFEREQEHCDGCGIGVFTPYFRAHLSKCKNDDKTLKYFPSNAYYCPNCELNVFDCDWEWHCREKHPDWTGGYFCDEEVEKQKQAGVKDFSKYIKIGVPNCNEEFFRGGSMHKRIIELCIPDIEKSLGKASTKSVEQLIEIASGKFGVVPLNTQIKMDPNSQVIYNVNTGVIGYIDPLSDDIVVQKSVVGDYSTINRPAIVVEEGESSKKKKEWKPKQKSLKDNTVSKVQYPLELLKDVTNVKEPVEVEQKDKKGNTRVAVQEPGTPSSYFTCRVCKTGMAFVTKQQKEEAWDHFQKCKERKKSSKNPEAKVKLDSAKILMNYGESNKENMKQCLNCQALVKTSRVENHLAKCPVLGRKQGEGGDRPWNTYQGQDERGTSYGRRGGGFKRKNRLAGYHNAALGITASRTQEIRAANARRARRTNQTNKQALNDLGKMLKWDWYKVDPRTPINEEELERKEILRDKLAEQAQKQGWSERQFQSYARELDGYIFNAKAAMYYDEDEDYPESGSDKEIPCRLCLAEDATQLVLVKRSKMREHNKVVHKTNGPFKHFKGRGESNEWVDQPLVNILPDAVSDSIMKVHGECAVFDKYEPFFEYDFKSVDQPKIGESITPDCMKFKNDMARKHMIEVTYVEVDKPIHHAWGFRYNGLFYLGAHVLAQVEKEKLIVNLPEVKVPFVNFVKNTFATVQDNVLYEVKQDYKVEFEKVANTKFTMPDHQDLTYKLLFTGTETGLFVEEMTPTRILTPGSGNAQYYVTCAKYSSNPGDSGSLVWAYNRKITQWVPIGVHYGDQGHKRLYYTFFSPQPTRTDLN